MSQCLCKNMTLFWFEQIILGQNAKNRDDKALRKGNRKLFFRNFLHTS